MSAFDLEAAAQVLRQYASAVIDEREGGDTVYEIDWIVRLEKCVAVDPTQLLTAATLAAEYARGKKAAERDATELVRDAATTLLRQIASEPWAREVDLEKWRRAWGADQ